MADLQNSIDRNRIQNRQAQYLDQQPNYILTNQQQPYPLAYSSRHPDGMAHSQYFNQSTSNDRLAINGGSQNNLNPANQRAVKSIEPQYPPLSCSAAFGYGIITFKDFSVALASFILFIYVLTLMPYFVNTPQVDSSGTALLWVMIALYSIVMLLRGVCHVFMGCASAGNCSQKIGLFASLCMPLLKYNIFRSIGNSVKTLVRPMYITDNISLGILLASGIIGFNAYNQLLNNLVAISSETTQITNTSYSCYYSYCYTYTYTSSSPNYAPNSLDIVGYINFVAYVVAFSICAIMSAFFELVGLCVYYHYIGFIIRLQTQALK